MVKIQQRCFVRHAHCRSASAGVLVAIFIALGLGGGECLFAQAPGRYIEQGGNSVSGIILATSPAGIEIEDENGDLKRVPLETITEIVFSDEPAKLTSARSFLKRGRPADALGELASVQPVELEGVPPLVVAEMEFAKAAAQGLMAVESGEGLSAAEGAISSFLSKHERSHHVFEMQHLLGQIYAKAGNRAAALQAFEKVSTGPKAFKIQALTGKGQILAEQGKLDEASREYDAALAISAGDEVSMTRKREAALGKALVLSQRGRHDEAIDLTKVTINGADPEDRSLLSRAYVVLGGLYRAMGGKDQDALIAYLTVDLVYNTLPDSHAEALFYLSDLWSKAREEERSRKCGQLLRETYPQSGWAKKLANGEKTS